MRAPRICGCGYKIAHGEPCPCQRARAKAKAARLDERRGSASERGYGTAWQKARAGFLRSHPSCAMCGAAASVVDHIVPHRGDQDLFWRHSNWQALCTPCHSGPKQRAEVRHAAAQKGLM